MYFMLFFGETICSAITTEDSLRNVLNRNPANEEKLKTYYSLIKVLCDKDAKEAARYASEMAAFADSLGDKKGKARAMNAFGNIYLNTGEYQKSLDAFLKALNIYEHENYDAGKGAIHNGIGNVYHRMGKHRNARVHFFKALAYYKASTFIPDVGQAYVNLGENYRLSGDYARALVYYNKGAEIATQVNNPYGLCVVWTNIGETYLMKNELDSARQYLRKVIGSQCNDHILSYSYNVLGDVYAREKRWNEALENYRRGISLADNIGLNYMLPVFYKGMSDALYGQGLYKESLVYYRLYHQYNDSLTGKDRQRELTELQAAYDLEKKDRQIETLNSAKQLAEVQSGRDRLYRNSFIAAFVLALVICFVLIRNAVLKQKMNRMLHESNAALSDKNLQIEAQKTEIEKINIALANHNKQIVKENTLARYEILKGKTNPHFLFNSLTSLSALVIRDKEQALEFIENFSDLYRMILEMSDSKLIRLDKEMEFVKNYLFLEKARFRENLEVELAISRDHNHLYIPSFAVQLCVENALKHNIITDADKLTLYIGTSNEQVIVRNNLQKKTSDVVSTATGQKSIIERYKLITSLKPEIKETAFEYCVTLPLLANEEIV